MTRSATLRERRRAATIFRNASRNDRVRRLVCRRNIQRGIFSAAVAQGYVGAARREKSSIARP
jgi:hypothetical protein